MQSKFSALGRLSNPSCVETQNREASDHSGVVRHFPQAWDSLLGKQVSAPATELLNLTVEERFEIIDHRFLY